ncbi:hypothetical protein [Leptothoe kymatousa]|uniref:LSDAT prokaryote domain-containing protein n=1 Tax=Leptothoe kymatousa TAU-MAC 1615 TaxID=2364775 RepID=A0ABS5Y2C7_9CYAN|nr:hypothetical protein [Leptothoe kymatousa]MBT9311989.1 hypothetical protein [Leptothoe kymatousa TAU-MAC 1615]
MPKTSAYGLTEHTFSNGQLAKILKVNTDTAYGHALSSIGLNGPTPTLLVIGGASLMSPESQAKLIQFFNGPLAAFSQRQNITVLDGGTDAGVIHMMGHARNHVQGRFNLVGVAPLNMVIFPGDDLPQPIEDPDDPPAELEPHHTHFFLVPGKTWGSESRWLAGLSETLAGSSPTMTLLINGGQISLKDMRVNLELGRKVTVVAGSGRLADKVANTISGAMPPEDEQIQQLVSMYYPKQISVFDLLNSSLDDLQTQLKHHFNVE